MKKMPPIEKIYEAWTAIADNRITMHPDFAIVEASDGTKSYTIKFSGNDYASDDNASYWRGYPGYPVIAVMMLQGKLPFDQEEAARWKDINWKALNTKFKNKYSEAVAYIAEERHIDMQKASLSAEKVMQALEHLTVTIKRKL